MKLNESAGYISQPRVQMLMENVWKKRLDAIGSVVPMSSEKRAATAVCLENAQKQISYFESIGATQSSDIGAYKRYALDMIGAVVPNLLVYDIASVQAIDNRIAMVNYMKYSYGTTKGATTAGTVFGDVRNFGASDPNYTSDTVEGEEIASVADCMLEWAPVVPGTVEITVGSNVYRDDGKGKLVAAAGGSEAGSVDYSTGKVTFTSVSGTATANYQYANEHVPAKNLPSITLSIESLPIKAKARRLAALWGFEASYELSKEYGASMEDLLSETASAEIAHEIDLEVMTNIRNLAAAAPDLTFSTVAPVGVSLQDHYDAFNIKLSEGSQKIYQATRRIRPNYVICGTNVATVITSIRTFKPDGGAIDTKGPYKAGQLGALTVFVSPDYDPNEFVLGYKGDTLLDAGYIYAPYMPIMTTSMVQLEDMAGRKGWCTMYGTRAVNDKMFIRGSIVRA